MATKQKYPQVGHRGTGRRKEATARVRIKNGSGKFFVNGELIQEYFNNRHALIRLAAEPLKVAEVIEKYDILVKAQGGGKSGQAGAISMGIARALSELNPEFKGLMRDQGFLTRDSRVKERKKYGLKKARKAFQFSKR